METSLRLKSLKTSNQKIPLKSKSNKLTVLGRNQFTLTILGETSCLLNLHHFVYIQIAMDNAVIVGRTIPIGYRSNDIAHWLFRPRL
jgi:hypothetical protein